MDIPKPEYARLRRRTRVLIASAAVVTLLAITLGLTSLKPAVKQISRNSVWIEKVRRGEMLLQVTGPGTLVPRESRWVATQVDSRVDLIRMRAGARVEPDTVLVELSSPDTVQQMDAVRHEVAVAKAVLNQAQLRVSSEDLDHRAAAASARATYDSARLKAEAEAPLATQGIVSKLQYQRDAFDAEALKVRWEAEQERLRQFTATMNSQVNAERAHLDEARDLLARREQQVASLHVRAGISGVVQEVLVQEGQRLAAGANIGRVARQDELRAELQIPETEAGEVRVGQLAVIDTRHDTLEARVARIDPAVKDGAVKVDLEFTRPLPAGLRPDLSVDGTIEVDRLADVLFTGRVTNALPNAGVKVYKVIDDGKYAQVTPVRLGRTSSKYVQIVEGLRPGDEIILSDTSAWAEAKKIRLVQ